MKGRKEESQTRRKSRIAVIDRELCNPQSCGLYLCNKVCPVNRSGQDCITVSETDKKPLINEDLCVGCGICCKKCPKGAIEVVNLPGELEEAPVHRYGKNLFALYRLPIPKKKSVTGLIGQNGVGKSTVLKILSGEVKPNSGLFGREQEWESIIERFRGTELQDYLEKLSERKIRAAHKPQQVDLIPKIWKGRVSELLERISQNPEPVVKALGMVGMLDKEITGLSGGELQLLAVAATMLKDADFYFFDEPSSYLDVYQRLSVAREIRRLTEKAVV
ncbi:MAG: ATP-binding cassette domain-containing protein, partial [Candidatus Aenigmatarchaeota archaeon]